jgi:hypothetical protein
MLPIPLLHNTHIHAPRGIRTCNPSIPAAADVLLTPHGHRDRTTILLNCPVSADITRKIQRIKFNNINFIVKVYFYTELYENWEHVGTELAKYSKSPKIRTAQGPGRCGFSDFPDSQIALLNSNLRWNKEQRIR